MDVRLNESVTTPMTCGALHPVVIFPANAGSWSHQELRRALVHEREHLRRGDWLTLCLTRVVCAVYWFNPLVWKAWSRLRLEAERTCDDAVLRGDEPVGYADQLVALAERHVRRPLLVPMAGPDDLSVRIGALLDETQRRGTVSVRGVTAVVSIASGVVAAIAVVHGQTVVRTPAGAELAPFKTAASAQGRSETWLTHQTGPFVISYRPEFAPGLDAVAMSAETAYRRVQSDLGWQPESLLPLVLIRDRSEIEIVSDALGPVPSRGNRLLVPMDLTPEARVPFFRHELTHLYEFERLWRPGLRYTHWMFEGLANYESGNWTQDEQAQLRALIRGGAVPSATEEFSRSLPLMNSWAAQGFGHAFFEFIEAQYGPDRVREFVAAWSAQLLNGGPNPFAGAGIASEQFDRGFAEFLRNRFN